jgi:hypothetical protein
MQRDCSLIAMQRDVTEPIAKLRDPSRVHPIWGDDKAAEKVAALLEIARVGGGVLSTSEVLQEAAARLLDRSHVLN